MSKFRTLELAKEFYEKVSTVKLKQPLRNQFERSLSSVVLNLAEGSAKPTRKDRRKFYHIALGSFREAIVILEITGYSSLIQDSDSLGAHLYKLSKNC